MKIEGSVAVVTGAASGIGAAMAHALDARGCRLVLADLDLEGARATAGALKGQALALACDVRDLAAVESIADAAQERFGDVDMVFNNAGVMPSAGPSALDADPADLAWVLSVNVVGTWNGCHVFGRRLAARSKPGWIINTASEHSLGVPHTGQAFYTASKHAVLGLSDVLRGELPSHVGISVLCPGLVQSQLWDAGRRHGPLGTAALELLPLTEAVMARGMPASEVAERAIEGVERGDFLIVTHAASRPAADRRAEETSAAFDAQAPQEPGWERYDVTHVIHDVLAERQRPS